MSTKVQLTGGAFQDPAGKVLANGYLLLLLSQDGQVNGGSQLASGVELKILLDANGNVVTNPAQYVWPNDVISPANTFYMVSAYTAEGQRVWGPNPQQVFSSPSPYNVGAWVPQSISTSTPILTYDLSAFYPGVIPVSIVVVSLPIERSVRFASNLLPSRAACGSAPTNTSSFYLFQNGTQFATLTFNAGSTTGVFSSISGAAFNAGDILTIMAPSAFDATLTDVGIVLSGVSTNQ